MIHRHSLVVSASTSDVFGNAKRIRFSENSYCSFQGSVSILVKAVGDAKCNPRGLLTPHMTLVVFGVTPAPLLLDMASSECRLMAC